MNGQRRTTALRGWVAGLAVAVVAVLSGCSQAGVEPVGSLLGSWSQARSDWVTDVMPIGTVLLDSEADVDAWIEGHAGADGHLDSLREVDLAENVLVIGGYARCMEYSEVVLDDDGELHFVVTRAEEDQHTDCAWAPYTIDAWAVPLEATGGVVPVLAGSAGEPASEPVGTPTTRDPMDMDCGDVEAAGGCG